MWKGRYPEKPGILLLTPTGVAAININKITFHSGLRINVGSKLYSLIDRQHAALRKKTIRLISRDEISMISSVLFSQVNQHSNEIFGYSGE